MKMPIFYHDEAIKQFRKLHDLLKSLPKKENGAIALNLIDPAILSKLFTDIFTIHNTLIEQIKKGVNLHPREIRMLIHHHYKSILETSGIPPYIADSCVATSIILIRSMATENYADLFYQSSNLDDLLYRLKELGNIFSAISEFALRSKLPRDIDLKSLLLPLIKQFKTLAEKIKHTRESTKPWEKVIQEMMLSFKGLSYGIKQLLDARHLMLDARGQAAIEDLHFTNPYNSHQASSDYSMQDIAHLLKNLSEVVTYLQQPLAATAAAALEEPVTVKVGVPYWFPGIGFFFDLANRAPVAITVATQTDDTLSGSLGNQAPVANTVATQTDDTLSGSLGNPPRPDSRSPVIHPGVLAELAAAAATPPAATAATPTGRPATAGFWYSNDPYGNSPETVRVNEKERAASVLSRRQ